MEKLKSIKECLVAQVQNQLGNLANVDAKELGEVVDMVKDMEEAIYYKTITKAMEGKERHEEERYYPIDYRDDDREFGRMYYDGGRYNPTHIRSGRNNSETHSEREMSFPMRDVREGRSPVSRRTYMESKEMKKGKPAQIHELEKYMDELTHDIIEMIGDASPEEQ